MRTRLARLGPSSCDAPRPSRLRSSMMKCGLSLAPSCRSSSFCLNKIATIGLLLFCRYNFAVLFFGSFAAYYETASLDSPGATTSRTTSNGSRIRSDAVAAGVPLFTAAVDKKTTSATGTRRAMLLFAEAAFVPPARPSVDSASTSRAFLLREQHQRSPGKNIRALLEQLRASSSSSSSSSRSDLPTRCRRHDLFGDIDGTASTSRIRSALLKLKHLQTKPEKESCTAQEMQPIRHVTAPEELTQEHHESSGAASSTCIPHLRASSSRRPHSEPPGAGNVVYSTSNHRRAHAQLGDVINVLASQQHPQLHVVQHGQTLGGRTRAFISRCTTTAPRPEEGREEEHGWRELETLMDPSSERRRGGTIIRGKTTSAEHHERTTSAHEESEEFDDSMAYSFYPAALRRDYDSESAYNSSDDDEERREVGRVGSSSSFSSCWHGLHASRLCRLLRSLFEGSVTAHSNLFRPGDRADGYGRSWQLHTANSPNRLTTPLLSRPRDDVSTGEFATENPSSCDEETEKRRIGGRTRSSSSQSRGSGSRSAASSPTTGVRNSYTSCTSRTTTPSSPVPGSAYPTPEHQNSSSTSRQSSGGSSYEGGTGSTESWAGVSPVEVALHRMQRDRNRYDRDSQDMLYFGGAPEAE
ncbi:unnamed protein product [Amoebophrya sp. A25]|nr:unnamed protein product [Amoebophrya sp. A25]|eukprot:GSA25T00009519001.1